LPSHPQGSWVELHFSNNRNGSSVPALVSTSTGDMEKVLLDAQHESRQNSSKSSHCDRIPRSQTSEYINRAAETDSHSIGEKNSSKSEESYVERRKEVESIFKKHLRLHFYNNPIRKVLLLSPVYKHPTCMATLSMRNTSIRKGGIFSAKFLKIFLLSWLFSHLLATGLGMSIKRWLTTSTQHLFMKNWNLAVH
uniref:Uncharacterized protein n=1 Tax=Theropithecus gelada TaxID=9565 RepID=A0A8D2ES56_THEGE